MQVGPRFADAGSFEHDYGMKWKNLMSEFTSKEKILKEELAKEIGKLHQQMEIAKYDYETEMLRQRKSTYSTIKKLKCHWPTIFLFQYFP